MIVLMKPEELKQTIELIGDKYYECPYLYLNLKKYGLSNKNISIWLDKTSSNINAIILKYYSGMHIFQANNKTNYEQIAKLIDSEKPSVICAKKTIIDVLKKQAESIGYRYEYGAVRKLSAIKPQDEQGIIKKPTKKDFEEITNLLLSDKGFGDIYDFKTLNSQLLERYKEHYGRNYILKDQEKVIAHAGTGAENDKIAILSYVITSQNYRRKGLAYKLCSSICNDVINERKDILLINYTNESTALYDKLGFKQCCKWGKLYIK